MNKICTSIEQSKKLIELGINVDTADMCHRYRWSNNSFINLPCAEKAREPITGDIPAWSLAALLDVIPKHIKDYNVLRIDINEKDFSIWYDNVGYGVNTELPDITMESAVNACYEMILKLYEFKLIERIVV